MAHKTKSTRPRKSRKSTKPGTETQAATTEVSAVAPAVENTNLTPRLTPKQIIEHAEKETKPVTATATGARYSVLAGRPSKQGVIACFGKTGYALSWVARAERLGITPEELCERFKTDSEGVKAAWAALSEKK
jgi:hypothetical protein